ncbi:venom serine protease inhibitor-like [Chrysoperla carnea]|uniref:venom serine protease inhibitor-like n=1 Tax=Chrysoperla carnea TaxID=189513 RepID=UPI001D09070D|nr:venom serine protease inhibitor-like [Chrysoperla carnea]
MICKFVLLSAIVLVNCVYSNAFAFGRGCGKNEVFSSCGSPSPKTCDNYREEHVSPMMCMPLCECVNDMVRNKLGECVPTSECDKENREKRDVPNCGKTPKSEKRYEETRPRISTKLLQSLSG